MSKKRKTRHQKIMAATRRNFIESAPEILSSEPTAPTAVSLPRSSISLANAQSAPDLKIYTYVFQDARKTLLAITVIAALNIVLFLILKMKIVSLFGIVF